MSMLSPEALTRDGTDPRWSSARTLVFLEPPPRRQPGPQLGDLDFQGGDLLARSLGSDPPLLAAPGQVGRAVLVAFDGGLEVFELALAPISAHCGRSGSKRLAGRVVLASLSRRRFHGGFPAYLLLLIDWWGPLSHRPRSGSRETLLPPRPLRTVLEVG